MTDSRAYFLSEVERVQRGGSPGSEPIGDEEQRYAEGAPGAGAEVEQDQEQESAEEVELPDVWPAGFWNALTPAAQAEFERGEHDLVEEWQMWARGQVDTGAGAGDEELPAAPAELPPTADEAAAYGQQWLQLAREGGDERNTAGACFEQAEAWQAIARSAAIAEVQAGRRQSWDLSDEDQRAVVQDEIDRRVAAGRERYGSR